MSVMYHKLKTWPPYFQQVIDGEKTFEIRKNDRNFKSGDFLILMEYTPDFGLTGRIAVKKVGAIIEGEFGLGDGICVMSLLPA